MVVIAASLIICCICFVFGIMGTVIYLQSNFSADQNSSPVLQLPGIEQSTRTIPENNNSSTETDPFSPTIDNAILDSSYQTLETLTNIIIPENDPRDLAQRLKGVNDIPDTVPITNEWQVGEQTQFWVSNVDTNENRQINALLGYKTKDIYFWIEEGIDYDQTDLENLVETFENDILPINREFFGTEWTPGIDEDPRLYVVYAKNLGSSLAGYFSSADELPSQVHKYSNAHEMFLLNADTIGLDQKFTYGVLAHEYQHMIHWYSDRNETSWLNEGFAELAAFLNGYYESGFDSIYLMNTDVQLNDWPNDSGSTTPHYGAAFLFVDYFLNRFGEEATKALVNNSDNGMNSVDKVLTHLNITDPVTNLPVTADSVFEDWIIANYVLDNRISNGIYDYENYPSLSPATITEKINTCDFDWKDRTVSQYGVDYIDLQCNQDFTLHFSGTATTNVIDEFSYSGDYAYWSNKGDESQMVLSHSFDFSGISDPIDMTFMTWYDIETDYDYVYLTATTDGVTYQILESENCTKDNPSGNSYGCGFNGESGGWIEQSIDLTQFAGQTVTLQFEYVTDAAVNGEGFLLDDVAIPAINYFSDFEEDGGGWESNGWARTNNLLPQTYKVILLEYKSGTVNIQELELSDNQDYSIQINGKLNNKTILIVSGTTRFTRQPAIYRIRSIQ